MRNKSMRTVVTACIIVLTVLFGAIGVVPVVRAAEPIKIGVIMPYTGPLADYAPFLKEGLMMRLEEVNSKVAGRPIELILEDGGNSVALSLDKAKKLVEMDKVCFVIGPISGDVRMGVSPYLGKKGIPTISLMGSPFEELQFGSSFIYPGTYYSSSSRLGWYMYDTLGYRTITTIGADYAAGHELIDSAASTFKEKGGKVIQQQWAPVSTADYGPYIANMQKADAVLTWSITGGLLRFLKQYKEFGMNMPVAIAFAASVTSPVMKELDKSKSILGTIGTVEYSPLIDNPENKSFVARFQAKYNRKPEKDHANMYNAFSAVLAAIEATKGDTRPDKLRAAMLSLKLKTPQGPLSFSPKGVAVTNRYVCKASIVNGEYLWDPLVTYPSVPDPRDPVK